ncbi:MAG: hypothetical protein ACRDSN_02270 [Pseudonocardiaceae bacterium]
MRSGRRLIDASTATYPFAKSYVALPHVRLIRGFADRGDVGRVEVGRTSSSRQHGRRQWSWW